MCVCPSNEMSMSQNELPSALFTEVEAVVWLVSEVGDAQQWVGRRDDALTCLRVHPKL